MSVFERFLSIWVFAGIVLANLVPGLFALLASLEYASVNLAVAILIWAMVYPMMVAVESSLLRDVVRRPKGLVITLTVHRLIKPFTMAALGVLFFHDVFAGFIDPENAGQYIAGLIRLGAAPCTAMVFVWSNLTKGDPNYTLVQVLLNDVIMIFAFAPIVALLLGLMELSVPWDTLVLSVVLYVVLPLAARAWTRARLMARSGSGRVHNADQTGPDAGAVADSGAAVRVPGPCHPRHPLPDRTIGGADPDPILWDVRYRLSLGMGMAGAP